MKIGMIGTGNMARSLGILWTEQGHEVFFGSRDADKGKSVAEFAGHGAKGGINDEAAAFGEVIFYSVRVMPSTILSSTEVLSSKVLIDCNNRETLEGYAFEPIFGESLAMVEGLGDFIRFMIGGMQLGPYATISVNKLPEAKQQRLGGRNSGYR